jgi:Fe-S cluster assembly iron-binding protein IscA
LGLALDEPGENEEAISINGVDVLITEDVVPLTDGRRLDYIKSDEGEGFVIVRIDGQSCC